MPFIERSMFEKHAKLHHEDDDMHVEAISNPEEAAHIAALKLVMNTHLREKIGLLDSESKNRSEYLKTIINQKNMEHILHDIINTHQGRVTSHHAILGRG